MGIATFGSSKHLCEGKGIPDGRLGAYCPSSPRFANPHNPQAHAMLPHLGAGACTGIEVRPLSLPADVIITSVTFRMRTSLHPS